MATKKALLKKIAQLESMNDQIVAELHYVDDLMRRVGFSNGLASVKETAVDLIEDESAPMKKDEFDDIGWC